VEGDGIKPAWLSYQDAVKYTSLGERTLRRIVASGEIECRVYRASKTAAGRSRRLISKASLDRWIASLPLSA
tara:strand:- start:484 stop:699 length:216 start_codon:yes stop_codon:yes gene_type:complete